MNILKVKDPQGNWNDIPAIVGKNGEDYVLTSEDKEEIAGMVEIPVEDVQVNGTSVVTDGVANIPYADSNTFGLVKPMTGAGTAIAANGALAVVRSYTSDIKTGQNEYKPIVPCSQHVSTFYGLAKLAGVDMASSDNPVGTYTDAAKVAIQKMLGIYEAPWELIREDTVTNETEESIIIDVDGNGNSFELTDVVLKAETPTQETGAKFGSSGAINFYTTIGHRFAVECGGYTQAANTSGNIFTAVMKQHNNMIEVYRSIRTTVSNTGALGYRVGSGLTEIGESPYSDRINLSFNETTIYINKMAINKITGTLHYRLYGKRKWQ